MPNAANSCRRRNSTNHLLIIVIVQLPRRAVVRACAVLSVRGRDGGRPAALPDAVPEQPE